MQRGVSCVQPLAKWVFVCKGETSTYKGMMISYGDPIFLFLHILIHCVSKSKKYYCGTKRQEQAIVTMHGRLLLKTSLLFNIIKGKEGSIQNFQPLQDFCVKRAS